MTKRRRRPLIIRWTHYRAYLIATYTHTGDAAEIERRTGKPTAEINDGALRGFLLEHKEWGIAARRELWPKLRPHIYLPYNQNWNIDMVLSDGELIRQTLGDPRHNRAGVRRFVDLWGPKGPLAIPPHEWFKDPGFRKWLDSRRT